jgi:hypothetical protein
MSLRYDTSNGVVILEPTNGVRHARLCPAAALAAYTRTNNDIEANGVGALGNLDGVAAAVGDVVVLTAVATASDVDNGLWRVTGLGSAGTTWTMSRHYDADIDGDLYPGSLVYVSEGTRYGGAFLRLADTGDVDINTDTQNWSASSEVYDGAYVRNFVDVDLSAGDYNVTAYDTMVCVSTSDAVNDVVLPTAATSADRLVVVVNTGGDATATPFNISVSGGGNINGAATLAVGTNYAWALLWSDATLWYGVVL